MITTVVEGLKPAFKELFKEMRDLNGFKPDDLKISIIEAFVIGLETEDRQRLVEDLDGSLLNSIMQWFPALRLEASQKLQDLSEEII